MAAVEGGTVGAETNVGRVRPLGEGEPHVIAKSQIVSIQSLDGTELAPDVSPDRWSGHQPDLA